MKEQSKKLILPDYEYETQVLRTTAQHFPILNTDLIDVAAKLEKMAKLISKAVEMPFSEFNISRVGFFVLMCLKIEPPVYHASEIAKRWGVEKEAMGRVVETLKRAGYVKKGSDSEDGRARKITITDDGEDLFQNVLKEYSKWLSEVFGELNKSERERLTELTLNTKNLFFKE